MECKKALFSMFCDESKKFTSVFSKTDYSSDAKRLVCSVQSQSLDFLTMWKNFALVLAGYLRPQHLVLSQKPFKRLFYNGKLI